MTKWELVGREYIGTNNVTRVTLTEETNWQRIVANIAGDLREEDNEAVIDRAISEFIKRERPNFAQEFVDQELVTLKEELEVSKKTITEHQEEIDVTKGRLTETQGDLEETKSSIASIQEQVSGLVLTVSNLTEEQKEALDDKYDDWESGKEYAVGDRVHYDGVNYEVIQGHTSQSDWLPSETPSLYTAIKNDDLETDEGTIEVIDEFEENSTNPYGIGDKVTFQGEIYESTIDNNVWSPADYPQGWVKVE